MRLEMLSKEVGAPAGGSDANTTRAGRGNVQPFLPATHAQAEAQQARVVFLRHDIVTEWDDASDVSRLYKVGCPDATDTSVGGEEPQQDDGPPALDEPALASQVVSDPSFYNCSRPPR
jgi:hypothetical protein